MPDLVSKMEGHLQSVREMAVIDLDMTEYMSLIFFCNFDFQKYLNEYGACKLRKEAMDPKDSAFLKNMDPNRELHEKMELHRQREKKKIARLKSLEARKYNQEDLAKRSHKELDKFENEIWEDDEYDYREFIDPELIKGNVSVTYNTAEKILSNLTQLEDISKVIEECERIINMGSDLNEEYLERLLGDVKQLYKRFESSGDRDVESG